MARKPEEARWEYHKGFGLGRVLMLGRSALAHAWEANGYGWMSLMCEAGKRGDLPPVHGPYQDFKTAQSAAELGMGHAKIQPLKLQRA